MSKGLSEKIIVLCADDFGLTQGVSEGILDLVNARRLSAVSCMTVHSDIAKFSRPLIPHGDHVDIGLHFVLTDLKPIKPCPRLTTGGHFFSLGKLASLSLLGKLPLTEVKEELASQLEKFINVFGSAPDFIDGHHHIHQLPGIRIVILELIEERLNTSPPYIRVCSEKISLLLRRGVTPFRAAMIGLFGASLRRRATQRGLCVNKGFSGVYDFSETPPYSALFERFVEGIRSGGLIMCHPGRVDEELRAKDSLTEQREIERDFLLGNEFPALLNRKNIRLGRFHETKN